MIKITMCLTRLPHLTREQFQDYWINKHGVLVRSFEKVLRIRRYTQTHAFAPAVSEDLRRSRNSPEQFDGVAESWMDSFDALAELAKDPEARAAQRALIEDEKRFIDLPRSPLWWGEEKVMIG